MNGLLACGIATVVSLVSCDSKKSTESKSGTSSTKIETTSGANTGRIAYVDMDTLQAKYEYLKAGKASLEKESEDLEAELAGMSKNMQSVYNSLAAKEQSKSLSPIEREDGQKKLQQMQQNMEARKQNGGAALMKKTDEFTKQLQAKLDAYLLKYNADKHFDYVLQYQKGGMVLLANPALNITDDVIKGLDAEDKAGAGSGK